MTDNQSQRKPCKAMVLAAGLGKRMRPLTDRRPKPLIEVQGRSLIDRVLDHLEAAGIAEAVVNLHHCGSLLRQHLEARESPRLQFSEEETLLETGGGIVKALPLLGDAPFYAINGDVLWLDGTRPALERLAAQWNPEKMDALLLMQPTVSAQGYDGPGDFRMEAEGRLSLRPERELAPFVFSGLQILSPRLFAGCEVEPFALMRLYRTAAHTGRLYGVRHEGTWFHVGTPEDLAKTEESLVEMGFHPAKE
ncbi:MAG: nucleotidyltransferase family protein [Rhodospirillales bacterium]